MKVKVYEAQGTVLDWLVAQAEGNVRLQYDSREGLIISNVLGWIPYRPSLAWQQGGPIIDREKIDIRHTFTEGGYRTSDSVDAVHATIKLPNGSKVFDPEKVIWEYGPTPLIAAMRCYVISKLGEEVEVPDELIVE